MRAARRLTVVRDGGVPDRHSIGTPRSASARKELAAALRAQNDADMHELGDPPRPRTRADCVDGPRPCPWAGCRHHLGIDVMGAGGLRLTFPERDDPTDLEHSCSLDVADDGVITTLEDVAILMNMSRERARQIEEAALDKLRSSKTLREMRND